MPYTLNSNSWVMLYTNCIENKSLKPFLCSFHFITLVSLCRLTPFGQQRPYICCLRQSPTLHSSWMCSCCVWWLGRSHSHKFYRCCLIINPHLSKGAHLNKWHIRLTWRLKEALVLSYSLHLWSCFIGLIIFAKWNGKFLSMDNFAINPWTRNWCLYDRKGAKGFRVFFECDLSGRSIVLPRFIEIYSRNLMLWKWFRWFFLLYSRFLWLIFVGHKVFLRFIFKLHLWWRCLIRIGRRLRPLNLDL